MRVQISRSRKAWNGHKLDKYGRYVYLSETARWRCPGMRLTLLLIPLFAFTNYSGQPPGDPDPPHSNNLLWAFANRFTRGDAAAVKALAQIHIIHIPRESGRPNTAASRP